MKAIDKAVSWYFSRQALPYWIILTIDCLEILLSGIIVYTITHGIDVAISVFPALLGTMLVYLIPYIISFRIFRPYIGVMRFASFADLRRLGSAVLTGFILIALIRAIFNLDAILLPVRDSTLLFTSLSSILLMWGTRIIVKSIYDSIISSSRHIRVFIYGVRDGGVAIAKSINAQSQSPYVISGFACDEADMIGKRLMGHNIYAGGTSIVNIMRKKHASTLLVSPRLSDSVRNNPEMVDELIAAGIKIMMFPAAKEWDGKSELNYTQLRSVNVEELLPRDKIEIDMDAVGNLLRGKRILITGAAGSIGSEMVRQIAPFKPEKLILVDQAETPLHDIRLMMIRKWPEIDALTIVADIANQKRMEEIFRNYQPEYVFHAAAYKHVPMMEDNPSESIENNVNGTRIIADLAVKYGTIKFVMVSTDKAVNPTNVMGCSKRICEIYVQALDKAIKDGLVKGKTQFVTTRFGNVLGSNGSVIPLFESQIKAGGPVTVTHPDIIRFFMLIPEACKLVLEAGTMGTGGEIFVFDMGKPVKIADLARRMIKMSGAKDIEIKYTGLRDGEKLYEEVLNDKEITMPTFHNKIKIAKVREYDFNEVSTSICDIIKLATTADDMTTVAAMKALVPEFRSQHSKYEALDHKTDTHKQK